MAKRDIVDHKARTHIDGVGRVSNTSAWGEAKATERYGGTTRTFPAPPDDCYPQKLGDRNNLQDSPRYQNDTPNNWLRGAGESAEGKPNYVPGYRAPHGEPGDRGGPPLRVGAKRSPHR